ncbi:MAG TPA: 50S ribosomal protein L11 methyltransferase [Alphaproteobacteria bacterium]|nr:50S ribosomal protein L11 methyltransferase [Alphaproteobacteria bacterium]
MRPFSREAALAFVRAHTVVASTALLPEIWLHLASEITPLWQATEVSLEAQGVAPPYWAFAWVGGQALARYVLDRPQSVRGRRVLDFAAGSGIAAIAAALAGARQVAASELDPLALAALALNAAENGVTLSSLSEDLTESPARGWDVILAGDVCYERPMAERVAAWLAAASREGALVLLGDPGRAYLPQAGLVELARYTVETTRELEDRERRETAIYRVDAR